MFNQPVTTKPPYFLCSGFQVSPKTPLDKWTYWHVMNKSDMKHKFIGLVEGKIYRKPCFSFFPWKIHKFSLKPIQWLREMVKNVKISGLSEVWWLARGNELWSYTICFGGTGGIDNIHELQSRCQRKGIPWVLICNNFCERLHSRAKDWDVEQWQNGQCNQCERMNSRPEPTRYLNARRGRIFIANNPFPSKRSGLTVKKCKKNVEVS